MSKVIREISFHYKNFNIRDIKNLLFLQFVLGVAYKKFSGNYYTERTICAQNLLSA